MYEGHNNTNSISISNNNIKTVASPYTNKPLSDAGGIEMDWLAVSIENTVLLFAAAVPFESPRLMLCIISLMSKCTAL